MKILISDYFAVNRSRLISDLWKVYFATILIAGGIFGQALIHNALEKVLPGPMVMLLLITTPAALVLGSHAIAALIVGFRLARAAGLPLNDFVRSEIYQQHGRATLRVFLK